MREGIDNGFSFTSLLDIYLSCVVSVLHSAMCHPTMENLFSLPFLFGSFLFQPLGQSFEIITCGYATSAKHFSSDQPQFFGEYCPISSVLLLFAEK